MNSDGLRLTPQRRAVLEVIADSPDHPTAAQVLDRVRDRVPGVGPATVYRTLAALVDSASVAEIHLGEGRATRYDRTARRHDHLICIDCGSIQDVALPVAAEQIDAVSATNSFTPMRYEVSVQGRCSECAARHQATPTA